MAKGSKKGACSAHVDAAKANCLKHDRREGKIPSYVNPHLTHTNRTVFEDEMIRGRKSITPLVNRAEKLYTEKTGQKCQKSFAPFREDVLRIKAGITDDQLLAFKDQVEKATGWKVVGIWLHQDEGHYHSKYIEGDENYAINYHAHVLYSCQDQETGKAIRLGRNYFRLRQDWLAEATGMERGNSATETGIRHRSSQQQRIDAQEKRIEELEREIKDLRDETDYWNGSIEELREDKTKLQESIETLQTANDTLQSDNDALTAHRAHLEAYNAKVREETETQRRIAREAPEPIVKTLTAIPLIRDCLDIIRRTVLHYANHAYASAILSPADVKTLATAMQAPNASAGKTLGDAARLVCDDLDEWRYNRPWEIASKLLQGIANGIEEPHALDRYARTLNTNRQQSR